MTIARTNQVFSSNDSWEEWEIIYIGLGLGASKGNKEGITRGIKGGYMMDKDKFVVGLDSRGSNGEMNVDWFGFGRCFPFWREHFDGIGLLFTLEFLSCFQFSLFS